MTEYNDLPQEVKDNVTEAEWNTLLADGVVLENMHG